MDELRKMLGAVVLAACLLAGCSGGEGTGSGRTATPGEIPRPESMEGFDEVTRELVRNGIEKLEQAPEDPTNWGGLAAIYQANELFDQALEAYEQAVAMSPEHGPWWYQLARVAQRVGSNDRAMHAITRSIELEPSYVPSYWRRGTWYLEAGNLLAAEKDFRTGLELAPGDPANATGLARVLLDGDEPAAAVDLLEPVVAANPGDSYAQLLLGNAYRAIGRTAEAGRALEAGQGERLERNDPWTAEVMRYRLSFASQVNTAVQFIAGGDVERGVPMLERLREVRPDDARVLRQLGHGYLLQGRLEESLATLEEAVRLHPDDYKAQMEISSTYAQKDRFEDALRHAERAVELKPDLALAHAKEGSVHQRLKNYPEAIRSYQQALRLDPENAPVLKALGDCLGYLKQYELSAAAYQEAMQITPEDADIYSRMGFVLYRLGRYDGAERVLNRALELGTVRPEQVNELLEQVRAARSAG